MPAKNISINVPGKGNFFVTSISNAKMAKPISIDQVPIVRPNVLANPICKTSHEPTPKNCPLIVKVMPKDRTKMPAMKNRHRVKKLVSYLKPHSEKFILSNKVL